MLTSFSREFIKLTTYLRDETNADEVDSEDNQQHDSLHDVTATLSEPPPENTELLDITPENQLPAQVDVDTPIAELPDVASPLIEISVFFSAIEEEASAPFVESPISFETSYVSTPVKEGPVNEEQIKLQFVNRRRGAAAIQS